MKKIMLLGGSGALGSYLTPELLKMGYQVHVVSLDTLHSDNPNLTYETANVKDDPAFLASDDYSLAKARQEDLIHTSGHRHLSGHL